MPSKHNANIILSVQRKIQQSLQKLIQPSDARVLVAVSGGQDSLCLLHAVRKTRKDFTVIYCDHCWPTDIGIDLHIKSICADWDIPCIIVTADSNLAQTENAARVWRYQALTQVAVEEGFNYILTGHTQTDKAESVLFNISRGSDMKGLSAIRESRELCKGIYLVRPMLKVSRQQTGDYCQAMTLPVWEDVLNSSDLYTRNRIRLKVMPLLKSAVNNKVEDHLAQVSSALAEAEDYMDYQAQKVYRRIVESVNVLRVPYLTIQHIAIQKRVVKLFIEANQTSAVKRCHIEDIVAMYSTKSNGTYSCLAEGNSIKLKDNKLTYHKNQP